MKKKYAIIYIESQFQGVVGSFSKLQKCTIMELSDEELNDNFINGKLNKRLEYSNIPKSHFIDIKLLNP